MISIIIPTYNEARNIKPLFRKINSALNHLPYELILVDDNSPDKTAQKAEKLKGKYPLKVIVRKNDKDLSRAVVTGFKAAKGDVLGVMDADFAHPPEMIPIMVEIIEKDAADIVIGSRQIEGGKIKNWPLYRKIISHSATLLAKPLTHVKDPMSGFFFLKRDVIRTSSLRPRGYKILLEILVKGHYHKTVEIPIVFKNRLQGESKLSLKVYLIYLMQLFGLYVWKLLHK